MNPQQLAALKTYIDGQGDLSGQPMNSDGHFTIANKLNTEIASPDFFVWKLSVPVNEIMGNGFDWTRVDNMTAGEARIWEFMTQLGFINPHLTNVRAGVNEAFKGTAQDDTMRLAMYTNHLQTKATRGQKIFATGDGTTSSNTGTGPGLIVIETITATDVEQARNLP